MYGGSGLSIAMHHSDYENLHAPTSDKGASFDGNYSGPTEKTIFLGGVLDNKLRRINPIFCVRYDYLARAKAYFRKQI